MGLGMRRFIFNTKKKKEKRKQYKRAMFNLDSDSSNSGSEEMYWSTRKIKWKQNNEIKWERRQKNRFFGLELLRLNLGNIHDHA